MGWAPAASMAAATAGSSTRRARSATLDGPVRGGGPELGAVHGRMQGDLGHAGPERAERVEQRLAAPDGGHGDRPVGEQDAFLGGQPADGEAHVGLDRVVGQAEGEAEVDGELEVDVEELGPEHQRVHVGVEVADVEAPQHGPLDLGPALPTYLVEVGVVPHVRDRAGESAVAVEERRCLRDRSPAVEVVLGVQGEAHPHVVAPEPRCRFAGPWSGDQQRGRGGSPSRSAS